MRRRAARAGDAAGRTGGARAPEAGDILRRDQFVGDAVMIMFGAPEAMPEREQALAAVRMAVAMQERLAAMPAQWRARGVEDEFRVRIGINTGIASVGNFGSRERVAYTAIGRQVNLAARLEVACEPGGILLSHTTWALVRDRVPCVPKGELTVKGVLAPVKIYEVHRGLSASAIAAAGPLPAC